MATNRRRWLQKIALGMAGIGLGNLKALAAPPALDDLPTLDRVPTGDQPVILRSNENPYGPSPLARKAFADHLTISNRYNWEIATGLLAAIAAKNGVHDDSVLLGAGSTEILDLVARFAALNKGNYVIADPSYDYWTVTLDNLGLTKRTVALTPDKKLDAPAMQRAVDQHTRLVYICNPNNPTGTLCDREALVQLVTGIPKDTVVLVDEAYLDFTRQASLSPLVQEHPNLVVAKTFSKIYGLAGARIGYAIANKALINNLVALQSNTNNSVSTLSKLAALASLKDDPFVAACYARNEAARNYTITELQKLNCECIPSQTNFIYFSLDRYKKDYFRELENHNIQGTRIYEEPGKWTRITVGTMDEMKRFIRAIQ